MTYSNVNERWQRLSIREQRLVTILGLFVLAIAAYSLVWQPTRLRLESAERGYHQQRHFEAQLQTAPPPTRPVNRDQPLSLRLSESANASGLDVQHMETDNGQIRLTLSGNANTLLQWLDRLERDGLTLDNLTLERREAALEARVVVR